MYTMVIRSLVTNNQPGQEQYLLFMWICVSADYGHNITQYYQNYDFRPIFPKNYNSGQRLEPPATREP
jgi:hypothetical protein